MYKMPVSLTSTIDSIVEKMQEDQENAVFECLMNVGITVDKDELLRALKYDREQYEKGYQDGLKHLSEDTVTDWMVEYIHINGIKCLMELVLQAIEREQEE